MSGPFCSRCGADHEIHLTCGEGRLAARAEAAEARVVELEGHVTYWSDRALLAEARVATLEGALESIVSQYDNSAIFRVRDAADIARAALAGPVPWHFCEWSPQFVAGHKERCWFCRCIRERRAP